jgi:hypothetical protein
MSEQGSEFEHVFGSKFWAIFSLVETSINVHRRRQRFLNGLRCPRRRIMIRIVLQEELKVSLIVKDDCFDRYMHHIRVIC